MGSLRSCHTQVEIRLEGEGERAKTPLLWIDMSGEIDAGGIAKMPSQFTNEGPSAL